MGTFKNLTFWHLYVMKRDLIVTSRGGSWVERTSWPHPTAWLLSTTLSPVGELAPLVSPRAAAGASDTPTLPRSALKGGKLLPQGPRGPPPPVWLLSAPLRVAEAALPSQPPGDSEERQALGSRVRTSAYHRRVMSAALSRRSCSPGQHSAVGRWQQETHTPLDQLPKCRAARREQKEIRRRGDGPGVSTRG